MLISLIGVILAVGIPAFVRSLRTSKMAEAPLELIRIHAALASYYTTPQSTPSGKRMRCIPEAAGPTPAQPSRDPIAVDFGAADTPGSATWRAIGYEPSTPIRYRYSILTTASGCGTTPVNERIESVLTLRAEGDLDGDGVLSRYQRSVNAEDGQLVLNPMLDVRDRIE